MDLAFLDPVLRTPGPWASAFIPSAGTGPDAATQQELAARDSRDQLARQGADDATCEAVYERLRTLSGEETGRAVFATAGESMLTLPLNEAPALPQGHWSSVPHLAPLVGMTDEPHRCLVAYVDKQGADFELRHTEGVEGTEDLGTVEGQDWPLTRTPTTDPSERHFQTAVENTWEQNAGDIADVLASKAEESDADIILIVGEDRQRRAVYDKLPVALQPYAMETDRGGRAAGAQTSLLDEEITDLLRGQAQRHSAEVLDRFRVGRTEKTDRATAAEGVPALVEAAREHRVETLLLRPGGPDLNTEVWVGDAPDQLALRRSDVKYLGEPQPESARADDALLRAVAATGGQAVVVNEEDAQKYDLPAGGLGAVLRWSQPEDRGAATPEEPTATSA